MNKYKKTFSQKNKMRKTLKINHMLKNKYRKSAKKKKCKTIQKFSIK